MEASGAVDCPGPSMLTMLATCWAACAQGSCHLGCSSHAALSSRSQETGHPASASLLICTYALHMQEKGVEREILAGNPLTDIKFITQKPQAHKNSNMTFHLPDKWRTLYQVGGWMVAFHACVCSWPVGTAAQPLSRNLLGATSSATQVASTKGPSKMALTQASAHEGSHILELPSDDVHCLLLMLFNPSPEVSEVCFCSHASCQRTRGKGSRRAGNSKLAVQASQVHA